LKNKKYNLYEKNILLAFIVINVILYYFSYSGATFIEGADASQYYFPAISLLEKGQFLQGVDPLTFGPPLYSIFLTIPISFIGVESATGAIVFMQCTLLYLTGIFSRRILLYFSSSIKFGLILHAMVIFNPNSMITAHLIQSETLFTFFFIWSVFIVFRIINKIYLKDVVLLGVLVGLATLTRAVGLYFLIFIPIFILISIIARHSLKGKSISLRRDWLMKLSLIFLVGGLVISPWYVRNYINFDKIFYTSNSGAYLQAQYYQLKNKGSGWSATKTKNEHKRIFSDYIAKKRMSNFCLDNDRHWSCNSVLTYVSFNAIINEPLRVHAKALIDSWATLFLSGGASNIRNYLGISGKDLIVDFQNKSFKGLDSILKLINDMNFPYLFIFTLTILFSSISRIIGLIGVYYLFKNKEWRPYGFLLIEIISLFTAAYLYLGQSRFRVPLEPLLMLFAVIGFLYIDKILKRRNRLKYDEIK
jgi:hypothetical protein